MKTVLIYTLLALILATPVRAEQNLAQMLKTAQAILAEQDYEGDTSAAQRLLDAILEKDPNHPEALWELVVIEHLSRVADFRKLHHRANGLAAAGKAINTIVVNARHRNKPAFAHYVLARYASFYKAYERALVEIDSALKLKPDSIRYRYYKGSILSAKGSWEKQDDEIIQGIAIIEQAHQLNHPGSDFSFTDAEFYFKLAWYNSMLTTARYDKTIEYYQAVIKHNEDDKTQLAYSWNNSSIAYRKLGQCQEAKHSAEQALEVMSFGAARSNLQYANFCLEMDSLIQNFNQGNI